jgi:hypothetical protein
MKKPVFRTSVALFVFSMMIVAQGVQAAQMTTDDSMMKKDNAAMMQKDDAMKTDDAMMKEEDSMMKKDDAMMSPDSVMKKDDTMTTNLSVGSQGAEVAALQTFLEGKGLLVIPAGVVKGYFGQLTKAALMKYQTSVDVPATGYFGPITRGVMANMMMQKDDAMKTDDAMMKKDKTMKTDDAMMKKDDAMMEKKPQ